MIPIDISNEEFAKTEGKLYRYFKNMKYLGELKDELKFLEGHAKEITDDIKNNNFFEIVPDLNMGIDYSRDKVQTSFSGSLVEKGLAKESDQYSKGLIRIKSSIAKLKCRIRNLEWNLTKMRYNVESLKPEYREFVGLKYGEKDDPKSIREISELMYAGAVTTARRRRKEIVEKITKWELTFPQAQEE